MNIFFPHKSSCAHGFTHQNFSSTKISKKFKRRTKNLGGFTLVEMIVAIGLFTIVTFLVMSAFLTVVSADKHSRGVRIATDNLSLALEDMVRRIKTGSQYICDGGNECVENNSQWGDGGTKFQFIDQDGMPMYYTRGVGPGNLPGGCGNVLYTATQGCIIRATDTTLAVATSPEIDIKDLIFWLYGADSSDDIQPFVRILVDGLVKVSASDSPRFQIEALVTQRQPDV